MTKEKKYQLPTPTKGKGGGKGSGKDVDLKDCPLEFKKLSPPGSPKYSATLREGEGLGLEDLDTLQFELESLLIQAVTRRRHLADESDILQNIEKHKGRSKKHVGSPGKRMSSSTASNSSSGSSSAKKLKLNSGKPAASAEHKSGKTKSEGLGPLDQAVPAPPPLEQKRQLLPKNETPNRFWSFVEPYCAPIQLEDVKYLEDMIKGYSEMGEFYRTPPLGTHYSIRWAKEDLENEKAKSSSGENGDIKIKTEEGTSSGIKKEVKSDSTPFGELTQRLIQGLMEESNTNSEDGLERSGEQVGSRNSFIQSLRVSGEDTLEDKIKKELIDQGILDPTEGEGDESDEIQEELARCQAELRSISGHNQIQLKRLLKLAREELNKQEIRNKLTEADNDVKEAYQRISAARVKKRTPTKKEKDGAWKAIKDREAIIKQIEALND